MEAKRVGSNRWEVYTDGGREKTGVDAVQWARKAIQLGVGEIIVTSVDRDGTRKGYDFELTRAIASFSPIPVIAHGGAGTFESFKEILKTTRLDALAAGSVFHYGNISIASLKKYLHQNKIAVRT
jgi:cyclase